MRERSGGVLSVRAKRQYLLDHLQVQMSLASAPIPGNGSTNGSSPNQIVQLVHQLVGKLTGADQARQSKLTQYVLRILGSRLPPSPISDEYALISLMKKYLANNKTAKDAIELEAKYNRLKQLGSFSQLKYTASSPSIPSSTLQFSVLYLLYQLRHSTSISSLTGGQQTSISDGPQHLLISEVGLHSVPLSSSSVATKKTEPSKTAALVLPNRHIPQDELAEHALVRDLVFVLQGLEGQYFKYNSQSDRYELGHTLNVSRPMRILAQRIAELGSLFSKVRAFLERTQVSHSSVSNHIGLISQSFREGVAEEIVAYYRMISVLEAQVRGNATAPPVAAKQTESIMKRELELSESTMTLRKLAVWTSEPMRRMKWLYMVIENDLGTASTAAKRESSHDLAASRMHQLTQLRSHGDPYLHSLGLTLEVYTSRPVLNMIQNWIFQGTLNDPYKEFFIIKNDAIVPRVSGEVGESSRLDQSFWDWSNQYLVLHSRIPPFISHKLAHKIMVIGKSINFMKTCCGDADWIAETTRKVLLQVPSEGVHHFDELRHPIHVLYDTINARLVHLILNKFHLMHHIEAIRKYLFLGQGDLIQVLMESLEPELSLPVGKQYRHNLLPIVDGALRASVASSWPSYLQDRCEVFLPTAKDLAKEGRAMGSANAPQDGWDTFELSYKLTSPLDAILGSPAVVQQHRAIFRFLWRLRRIQYILTSSWRLTTNCTRQLTGLVPEIVPLMQQVHLLRHQMTHFTSNIQYYIMFEVLETAWQELESAVKKAKSLDEILTAYAQYVSNIVKSSLIDDPESPSMTTEQCIVEKGYEPELTPSAMIWEVLDIIKDFDERTQDIYTSSHEVAVRREAARNAEPQYGDDGEEIWAITPEDEQADLDFLDHLDNVLCAGIDTITDQYKHSFDQLFTSLAHRMREGDNMYLRNLFQRVNFNCFYASESSSHHQTNPENASAILQATLGSMKDAANFLSPSASRAGVQTPGSSSSRHPHATASGNASASGGIGSITSPALAGATTTAAYTESILKQAAAKLRLSTLAASAQQRSSSPQRTRGSSNNPNQ